MQAKPSFSQCIICGAPATMECPCHPKHQYCGEEHQLRHWEEGHSESHDEYMQEKAAKKRRKRKDQDGMSPKGDRRKRRRKVEESDDSEERLSD